jgi:hypothetical protein
MTDEQWLGHHALDGENEEWTHVEVFKSREGFFWAYYDERDHRDGPDNGPFTSAWDAYNDATN